jgi:ribonuclease HI
VNNQNAGELTVYSDGASRNNPGEAGAGVFIMQNGSPLERIARYLGVTTNTIAEYTSAIIGLERALQLSASSVKLFANSELLVKQVNGHYKVKNEALQLRHARAKELIA